jgi:hypothetical protein
MSAVGMSAVGTSAALGAAPIAVEIPNPARIPGRLNVSSFPSATYTVMLELINAKRMWGAGDRTLQPWKYDVSALKPDYQVDRFGNTEDETSPSETDNERAKKFYESQVFVADHIRIHENRDRDELAKQVVDGVKSKLGTYKDGKILRVVVDVEDNEISFSGADLEVLETGVKRGLDAIKPGTYSSQLYQVDVVTPKKVLTITRDFSRPWKAYFKSFWSQATRGLAGLSAGDTQGPPY